MALGKKVKTLFLADNLAVATGVLGLWDDAIDSHTFQDDIRVIGVQVGNHIWVEDAAVNADQEYQSGVEVSRHGRASQDGAIARSMVGGTWSAAIVVPSGMSNETSPFCFPDGCGIDFDDGEVIYLHGFMRCVGTVAFVNYLWAIVYYVER